MSNTLKIKINKERPNFSVFATYFFGDDFYDYDSDGNSYPSTSKQWTELYMRCRKNKKLYFEIYPIQDEPLILEVDSENINNTYIIAYFLARETNGIVFNNRNEELSLEYIMNQFVDFNIEERLSLAGSSKWK